jgi:hypothetical protein
MPTPTSGDAIRARCKTTNRRPTAMDDGDGKCLGICVHRNGPWPASCHLLPTAVLAVRQSLSKSVWPKLPQCDFPMVGGRCSKEDPLRARRHGFHSGARHKPYRLVVRFPCEAIASFHIPPKPEPRFRSLPWMDALWGNSCSKPVCVLPTNTGQVRARCVPEILAGLELCCRPSQTPRGQAQLIRLGS